MKIGKTIVSEREKAISESERFQVRKKEEKRKKMSIAIFFAVILLIVVVVAGLLINYANERKKNELVLPEEKVYKPSVQIIDEDGSGYVTDKIKTAVGMLEEDFQDFGYSVLKVVVPENTTREIDVYLYGVEPYFKIHVDRNTYESAEDAVRMINYLDRVEKTAKYVDVRIAGRAYYKV